MIPLAVWLLLADIAPMVDEIYEIPASDWRWLDMDLRKTPVTVDCAFEVTSGRPSIRVALLSREDLDRLRAGDPHGFSAATRPGSRGSLHHQLITPGEYVMVVDNRASSIAAKVHLRISVDFSQGKPIRSLPRRRRVVVILLACGVFLATLFYAGRKLLPAFRPPPP